MDRAFRLLCCGAILSCLALVCLASTGCIPALIASGIYAFQGGNIVPAECTALEKQRVVVLCRPPASHEYRNAGASRAISAQVSALLEKHVKGIEVVSPKEVDNWIDKEDWDKFKDLGHSVKATRVVYIELDDFELYNGKTLYQGTADINIAVYDMENHDNRVWDRRLGQVQFPKNSGIPASDKPVQAFERQFVGVISEQIAEHFYKHDPNANFALDAAANN